MKKRSKEEKFFSFISISERKGRLIISWEVNAKLVANLQRLFSSSSEISETYIAQFFLKQTLENQANELPKLHICAYLDEICYWIGIKTAQKVANLAYTWLDCFQIARAIVAQPEKIFKVYNNQKSSLKTYAKLKLKTEIIEAIHVSHEIEKYSPTGLLRNITKRNLEQSLDRAGISAGKKEQYLLAWLAFKQVYHPKKITGSQKLSWPTQEELETIVTRYNQINPHAVLTVETIELILKKCIEVVYDYTLLKFISLDKNINNIVSDFEVNIFEEIDDDFEQWQEVTCILSDAFIGFKKF